MLQVRNGLATMQDGMDNLRIDLSKIHEYMMSLTTHKVTPNLIPPADLWSILLDVENKLKVNPKLALPVKNTSWPEALYTSEQECTTLTSVCHHQWHNLTICVQWDNLSTRSQKWTIKCKYIEADLKGTLSPPSNKTFICWGSYLNL